VACLYPEENCKMKRSARKKTVLAPLVTASLAAVLSVAMVTPAHAGGPADSDPAVKPTRFHSWLAPADSTALAGPAVKPTRMHSWLTPADAGPTVKPTRFHGWNTPADALTTADGGPAVKPTRYHSW
jgi:hypothetical protein